MIWRVTRWVMRLVSSIGAILGVGGWPSDAGTLITFLKVNPTVSLILVVGATAWFTWELNTLVKSGWPQATLEKLLGYVWGIRQFFAPDMPSGHVRGYALVPEGSDPPNPDYKISRSGVRFKAPWKWKRLPPDGEGDLWVATTFATAASRGHYSVLQPTTTKLWPLKFVQYSKGDYEDWHECKQSSDRYMRYRRSSNGHFCAKIPISRRSARSWNELCCVRINPGSSDPYPNGIPVDVIDLTAVSDLKIAFIPIPKVSSEFPSFHLPPAVYSQMDYLETVIPDSREVDNEKCLFVMLSSEGSVASIGNHGRSRNRFDFSCLLSFRQTVADDDAAAVDTLLVDVTKK